MNKNEHGIRLLINLSCLSPPLSGIGRYTLELTRVLLQHPQILQVRAVYRSRLLEREQIHSLIEQIDNMATQHGDDSSALKKDGIRPGQQVLKFLRQLAKQLPLARLLKQKLEQFVLLRKKHLFAGMIYWEPNYISLPLQLSTVITVHDLSHLYYPQFHPQDRVRWLKEQLPRAMDTAQAIIAVSDYTRRSIKENFPQLSRPVYLVPPAVSAAFFEPCTAAMREQIRKRYQLPEQYILSVGNVEPRKNLLTLLSAYEQLPSALQKQYPLVIIGASAWLSQAIEDKIRQIARQASVLRLGYIAQSDLPAIYQMASLFIYISLFEGFGMPVAEAMAAKRAVITSNCTSMPEVAAGTARLVDPKNRADVVKAMTQLLTDEKLRQQMGERAAQQSLHYQWQNSAQQLLTVFRQIKEKAG